MAATPAAPTAWHGAYEKPPVVLQPTAWGNGLFAGRAIAAGEVVFTETPLCCAAIDTVPHCAQCARSMASGALVGLADEDAALWPEIAPLPCEQGCEATYCSTQCRSAAFRDYHCALCTGEPIPPRQKAGAAPPSDATQELIEYFEESDEEEPDGSPAKQRNAAAAALLRWGAEDDFSAVTPQTAAKAELYAYCSDVLAEGPLEHCAEFPLLALRLVATGLALVRSSSGEAWLRQPFGGAVAPLFGGLAPFARMAEQKLPPLLDYERVWTLIATLTGMSTAEREWADLASLKMLFGVLFGNAIRIFPRAPFDAYMGRIRRLGSKSKAKALERVWRAVGAAVAAEAVGVRETVSETAAGSAERGADQTPVAAAVAVVAKAAAPPPPAGELDALMRKHCAVGAGAVFRLHSKINHACDANTQAEAYPFDNGMIQIVARRAIKKNEQLTLCYTNPKLTGDYGFQLSTATGTC